MVGSVGRRSNIIIIKLRGKMRGEWDTRAAFRHHFEPTRPFGHGISNFNEKDFANHLKLQYFYDVKIH